MLSDAGPAASKNIHEAVPSLEELKRDHDLWLEDGSVVLVAGQTAFKVYKGLLSVHSLVFSGIFSSATYADETYDGCPVVRVSDFPEDFKWLLTHLIPTTLPDMNRNHYFRYRELSALTRLAHKYQIDVVERHAVNLLKDVFVTDFEKWEQDVSDTFAESSIAHYNFIDVIYLARLTTTPSILPIAFYLCTQEPDILIDGQQREDGTLMMLDKADAKRCIRAYGELWRLSEPMLQRIFLAPCASCIASTECELAMRRMLKSLSDIESPNHLASWRSHIKMEFRGCATCLDAVIEPERAERCELWKKLPQIFGLQDEVKCHWPGY